jgi:hypothetical protein
MESQRLLGKFSSASSPIVQVPQQRRRLVLVFREAPARQLSQRVT